MSTFCSCCAAGKAKSNVDGSNCFVNSLLSCCCFICTAPCTRTKVRMASAIPVSALCVRQRSRDEGISFGIWKKSSEIWCDDC